MAGTRCIALLRGVNVGGRNIISKGDLARCFEDLGLQDVRTYIQSGNILFRTRSRGVTRLTATIERELASRFSYPARAVVMSCEQYGSAVDAAPPRWGRVATWKHNALFTLADLAPEEVLAQLPPLEAGLEEVGTGPGVLFWSASKNDLGRTTMMKLASAPLYQRLTVRNHNTVFKIRELLEAL